jgi:hypothetical protein
MSAEQRMFVTAAMRKCLQKTDDERKWMMMMGLVVRVRGIYQ